MHVLIVHQNFVDHRHPGGTRHLELARHLVRQGHQCSIIAGRVDYLTGKPIPERIEVVDGVHIQRSFAFATLHKSYFGRTLSFCSFMVSSTWNGLWKKKIDVVLGTSPPLFQLPSAWFISLVRRKPMVLEVRDLWPEFPVDMGVLKNPMLIRLARWMESFFYSQATYFVANSPGFKEYLIEKGVPTESLSIVPNGVETSMFDPQSTGQAIRDELGLGDQFVVTYAGAMGEANNLSVVLDAAERLKGNSGIHFLFVGGGKLAESIKSQIERRNLHNVTFGGVFPKDRMTQVLAASNLCLASLQNIRMFRTTYPNKVFDYMAAGRPTLLLIDGVIREVIENSRGGRFVSPDDDAGLAQAVLDYQADPDLCKQQGASARAYVAEHFERSEQAIQLELALQTAVDRWKRRSFYNSFVKRIFDFAAAASAALILMPVILILCVLIRWKIGTPVLFKQPRAGLNGRIFTLFKFRSMTDEKDEAGNLLPDEDRLTGIGRLLRTLSLDELPQLWNVIRGDMSLIGPRPLLTRYLARYTPEQARRHEVRPGITGWAQVNGRNTVSWDEKFQLDVWYVDHQTPLLDLKIIFKTLAALVSRKGVSADGHATMTEFMGREAEKTPTN